MTPENVHKIVVRMLDEGGSAGMHAMEYLPKTMERLKKANFKVLPGQQLRSLVAVLDERTYVAFLVSCEEGEEVWGLWEEKAKQSRYAPGIDFAHLIWKGWAPRLKKKKDPIQELQRQLFQQFLEFLGAQDKITKIEDLIPGFLYTWVHSPDRVHTGRAILRGGASPLREIMEGDAYVNIEIQMRGGGHGESDSAVYVKIWQHKKGESLLEGWTEEAA